DPGRARLAVNRWIAGAARICAAAVSASLDAFRFDDAANRLYHFVWGEFCDWYLEFSKPILQGGDADAVNETRAATGWVLRHILHLLHPFMPFLTEEVCEPPPAPASAGRLAAASPAGAADPIDTLHAAAR